MNTELKSEIDAAIQGSYDIAIFELIFKLFKWKKLRIFTILFHCNMNVKIPGNIRCESSLIGVLDLVRMLSLYEEIFRPGRPYVYSTILMVQLFIIKSWMRIPSNNTLHYFLLTKSTNDKLFKVCRLTQIPNRRRTIDRRFQVLPIGDIIGTMGICLYQRN